MQRSGRSLSLMNIIISLRLAKKVYIKDMQKKKSWMERAVKYRARAITHGPFWSHWNKKSWVVTVTGRELNFQLSSILMWARRVALFFFLTCEREEKNRFQYSRERDSRSNRFGQQHILAQWNKNSRNWYFLSAICFDRRLLSKVKLDRGGGGEKRYVILTFNSTWLLLLQANQAAARFYDGITRYLDTVKSLSIKLKKNIFLL